MSGQAERVTDRSRSRTSGSNVERSGHVGFLDAGDLLDDQLTGALDDAARGIDTGGVLTVFSAIPAAQLTVREHCRRSPRFDLAAEIPGDEGISFAIDVVG